MSYANYNTYLSSRAICCCAAKSFIIDHPKEPETKHLVHVCLEGPEAGVYYRGKGEITNNETVEISLQKII